jgi:hypothetical protein
MGGVAVECGRERQMWTGGPEAEAQRERFAASAYFALWGLYELDPTQEPEEFRRTRLALDRSLARPGDQRSGRQEAADQPLLRVVPERGDS